MKEKLFFLCLDRMLSKIEKRFSEVDQESLDVIIACCPTYDKFFFEPHLTALWHFAITLTSNQKKW